MDAKKLEEMDKDEMEKKRRTSFEVYKSNVCHYVKDKGDIEFLIEILETDKVREFYDRKWYPEAFYLLGMVDYLSRVNDVPLCTRYEDIRCCRLKERRYPESMLLYHALLKQEISEEEILETAIPEFLHFNIVESEVRDVC